MADFAQLFRLATQVVDGMKRLEEGVKQARSTISEPDLKRLQTKLDEAKQSSASIHDRIQNG